MNFATLKNKLLSGTVALTVSLTPLAVIADPSPTQVAEDSALATIQEDFATKREALQREIADLQANAPSPTALEGAVNVDLDVSWEMTSLKFDIPEVSMNTKSFAMHLPQFRMKRVSIKWDNPEIHMEMKTIGKYPCFRGWKWYSCDIKTKMPQIRMVRREAKFDIPEVFWDRTDFSLDIPEFRMKRVEIKLHLPQFKAKNVSAEVSAHQRRANDLVEKGRQLAEEEKAQTINHVIADITSKRAAAAQQFDVAISQLEGALSALQAKGIDPKQASSGDRSLDLNAQLARLREERSAALKTFDAEIAKLQAQLSS